ncbi:carboxymuconolactone decarboxylase family protein [Fictibacillus sp. NRS-1165]|uniref:carboxymuconolactone decarboxylase family protein n=1 Tax=Fictibacillus sp. NRS-1165 TaxID=3144463 RepID=UPI003D1C4975
MERRFLLGMVNPEGYEAMLKLEQYVMSASLDPKLKELIKIRASQINGCAYCIDMRMKDARIMGETEQRIYSLNGWRETPFFLAVERAVLALTESVTLVADTHVPDDIYEEVAKHFSEKEIAEIIMQIVAINAWNRIGVSTRLMPELSE